MLLGVTLKRILIGIGLIALLILTVSTILIVRNREGKIGVTIDVVPADAQVTIGGEQYKPGTSYFKEGTYRVTVKKPGFTSYAEDMYFDETRHSVIISLSPESSEAKKWARENQDEYDELFRIGQEFAVGAGSSVGKNNPIIAKLPHRTFIYTIGYIGDQSDPSGNSIILTIHASEGYRLAALRKIRDLGYDPTDFNIIFKDYENPFPL